MKAVPQINVVIKAHISDVVLDINLIKFRGVKLPGGLELNGREIYDDAERDIETIKQKMTLEYELPPLDMIG